MPYFAYLNRTRFPFMKDENPIFIGRDSEDEIPIFKRTRLLASIQFSDNGATLMREWLSKCTHFRLEMKKLLLIVNPDLLGFSRLKMLRFCLVCVILSIFSSFVYLVRFCLFCPVFYIVLFGPTCMDLNASKFAMASFDPKAVEADVIKSNLIISIIVSFHHA